MGKPNAPQTPSVTETAGAQTGSNIATALAQQQLNSVNQVGPQGSISYTQNGTYSFKDPTTGETYKLPKLTQTLALSPSQQKLYDTTTGTQQNLADIAKKQSVSVGNLLSTSFNTDGLPAAAKAAALQTSLGANDFSADRQRVEDALMGRLNTQIDRDRGSLEASLANRGIRLGSQAYSDAMSDFDRGVAENRTSAILNAGTEQNRLQQLALNDANFGNTARLQQFDLTNSARNQALNERLTTRNQALNENIGLATGTQVGQPMFGGTSSTPLAGTDIAGITANNNALAQQLYGQQMGQWNSTVGGLFGLGSSALMAFSDRELKTDIEDTGAEVAGVPVKTWRWKGSGEPDIGVIAQDVERKHPALVDRSHPSGYRRVNYGGLMRLGETALREAA